MTLTAVIAILGIAGCGGESKPARTTAPLKVETLEPGGPSGPASLRSMLGAVRAVPGLPDAFEFGDIAAQRVLVNANPSADQTDHTQLDKRWLPTFGVGVRFLSQDLHGRLSGLDTFSPDRALTVGTPGKAAVLVAGPHVDGPRVRQAIITLGGMPARLFGRDGLTWGAEGSQHTEVKQGNEAALTQGQFDRVVIGPHAVIAGQFALPVQALVGGRPSFLSRPPIAALADCLGDVIAVDAFPQGRVIKALGILRATRPAAAVREVVCIETPSRALARRWGNRLRRIFSPGYRDPIARQPLTVEVAHSTIAERRSHGVWFARARVALKPTIQSGYLSLVAQEGVFK